MRYLVSLMILFVCATSAFSDVVTEILSEFNITDTKSNRDTVVSIQKSINDRDMYDFKTIISAKPDNVSIVKNEIEKIDAPKFLLFLAMTESKFINYATSHKSASGMWQFMPGTAKAYGLDVNSQIDERRDPFLSTDTAFTYIGVLNEMFDNKWYLSLMAYNCGEGCMKRVVKNTGSDNFSSVLNSSQTPNETKKFIKKIIKYALISKDSNINSVIDSIEPEIGVERISVEGGTQLATVAKSIGLDLDDMKKINPHIKMEKAPDSKERYHFYIPEEKVNLYALNYIGKLIRGEKELDASYEIHRVAKDETLGHIAELWRVSVADIQAANNLKSSKISVGDELKIPTIKLALSDNKEYTIKNGDTLIGISKKFDVDIKELVATNDISSTKIRTGDKIVIP